MLDYLVLHISIVDAIADPRSTSTTPTTSIQFRFPGRMFESMVYCNISINTTEVLNTMLNVFPDMYCVAYIQIGHIKMLGAICIVISIASIKLLGKTGLSNITMAVAESIVPVRND